MPESLVGPLITHDPKVPLSQTKGFGIIATPFNFKSTTSMQLVFATAQLIFIELLPGIITLFPLQSGGQAGTELSTILQ